jgi:DNA-binding XRE family transcriptional regulator
MARARTYDTIPELAARLRDARDTLGITQADAGRRLGVSWITVLRWENGQSRPKSAGLRSRVLEFLSAAEQMGTQPYRASDHDGTGHVREAAPAPWGAHAAEPPDLPDVERIADRIAARVAAEVRRAVVAELRRQRRRKPPTDRR